MGSYKATYKEYTKKCSVCRKSFLVLNGDYVYKVFVNGRNLYQCSYGHWREEHKKYGLKEWEKIDD